MLLRESPRVIYGKNPLVNVTCQFNFPAILQIDTEIPSKFQERIRQQFPEYEVKRSIDLPLPPQLANLAMKVGNAVHLFKDDAREDDDEVWSVSLMQDSMSFSTTKYQRWEHFVEQLRTPLQALIEIYTPPYLT